MNKTYFILILLALTMWGCEGFWGTKTPTEFLDEPVFDDRTVAYVPIQPVWDDLSYPVDVIAGWDELVYVADQGTEEIISFDQAGNELGRFTIPGLTAIAQDRKLDILALGTIDTVISGTDFTLPTVYRLDLNKTGDYGLNSARIINRVIHPFYFKSGTPTISDEAVSFNGIAVIGNNRYYIARNGPSNSIFQFGGPDDAILLFEENDEFETPVSISTNLGIISNYFKKPQGITTRAQPPQNPAVSTRGDFAFASNDETNVLKVQQVQFVETGFGISYVIQNLPPGDTSKADRFLYEPNRFSAPADVTFSGDGTNYLFVVDPGKDSLYQFNADGHEGVNPPAGASSTKVILASFGGTGSSLTQFREPRAVAYLDKIVYVADAGNGRILRFQLTTDFD